MWNDFFYEDLKGTKIQYKTQYPTIIGNSIAKVEKGSKKNIIKKL